MSMPMRSDRGLRARMVVAGLTLALVYAVLIALLVAAGAGAIVVAVVAAVAFLAQYFGCEQLALRCLGARAVGRTQAPELHRAVERLCVAGDLSMPRLAIAPIEMPSVFTVGRTPSRATVCATTGLLALLDGPELEAVLARELVHIATRDVMVMTIGSLFASIAALIARAGPRRRAARKARQPSPPAVVASGLVYLLSYAILRSVAHERELVADRGAALLTGDPGALADALERLSQRIVPMAPAELRGVCGELAAFYVVAPDVPSTIASLCPTHPPLRERYDALARLWGAVGGDPALG